MTTAAGQYPVIGAQPVTNSTAVSVEVATATSGYVPLIPLGTLYTVYDPFWGEQEVIRVRVPAGSALIYPGTLTVLNNTYTYTALPNTANTGTSFGAVLNAVPANASFDQYVWVVVSGRFLVNSTASVAANAAIGVAAAGQAGANTAGKQLLNTLVTAAATATVVKAGCTISAGTPFIRANNSDGFFVGQAITGTGIPAGTSIGAIDASVSPATITMVQTASFTTVQNATATATVTVTGTNNDATRFWNTVSMQRPFVQGAIT